MKKNIIVMMMLLMLLVSGCFNKDEKYKKSLNDYGQDYYNKFMKKYATGVDEAEIELKMLRKANQAKLTTYDLKKLEKCSDSTKVILKLNSNDSSIKSVSYKLNCR